ncbi:MAG: DUF4139 domain-containing protein [Candidatus Cloacimonadia bacterium]
MKKIRQIGIITLLILTMATLVFAETTMTVYNQNFATVRVPLVLSLQKGINQYSLADIPSAIEPTSVHLTPGRKSDKVIITMQNFEYDLANTNKILNKYLDQKIEVITKNNALHSGILKAFDATNIIIQQENASGITMVNQEEIQNINLERMPENFYTKPTLNWELLSNREGNFDVKLSYITRNISWNAQYVGVLSEDEKMLNLASWISLDNRSGKAYQDVNLKLMAGEVHLAPGYRPPVYTEEMRMVSDKGGAPEVVEERFFEYHLYTVKERTLDINNNQQKQLSLFDPTEVNVKKVYTYNCNSEGDVDVSIKFQNTKENGLGIPLPAGRVRIFKKYSETDEEFIGEDTIDHIPEDEEVTLKVGTAFDIKADCTTTLSERPTKDTRRESYKIEIRNRKDEDINVEVLKYLGRNWEVERTDKEYEKKDAFTVKFDVSVPAKQTTEFSFTVLYKY